MTTIHLKPHPSRRIADGHLWVFSGDIAKTHGSAEIGEVVLVLAADGRKLGHGLYNPKARISVRMLGGTHPEVGKQFFVDRIKASLALRKRVLPGEEAYRVLFSEADLVSGLIIDRYNTSIVIQTLTAALDQRMPHIIDAIRKTMPDVTGIFAKNSAQSRASENLDLHETVLWGEIPDFVRFKENGVLLDVDLVGGQKTGYFLDQKQNRAIVGRFCTNKRVLDLFCNVGGFALNASKAGATEVLGIDSSQHAVDHATRHAELNGFKKCTFEKANAFDFLHKQFEDGKQWDVVVVDPPSFAKRRDAIERAKSGYASLNRSAMKVLTSGGILATASCTQLVTEYDLLDILYTEAARLRKRLRLLHRGQQSPDHPVLLAMPETQYLKFLLFDVVDVD